MLTTIALIVLLVIFLLWADLAVGKRVWRRQKLFQSTRFPLRHGDVSFYDQGVPFFKDYFRAIEQAYDHIHINFYIFRNDTIGKQLCARLRKKAREGVKVRVLVDWMGSHFFSKKERKDLERAGVSFAVSNRPRPPFWFFTMNRRNHRKITVVDGKIGFLGGFNVGDEYLGKKPELGNWRDYHIKIENDGVQDLQQQFLVDWKTATGEQIEGSRYYPELAKGMTPLQLFSSNGTSLEDFFCDLFNRAEQSIVIGTPYYIPGPRIQQALLSARKRGVAVTLLLPMKKDHPLVHEAAVPYFAPLIKAGCDIYMYYQGFYHAKVMIIDGTLCDVGTANLDRRSLVLNNEINCFMHDPAIIARVRAALTRDIRQSERLTLRRLRRRPLVQRL
ncbi:MAG TPA: cardiolipin synthase, partial [Bacillales bacterium]|nr:cardiolipin synthase [Bacillales bacterium]